MASVCVFLAALLWSAAQALTTTTTQGSRRAALRSFGGAAALVVVPVRALEKDFLNRNALFPEDFYNKFGTRPEPLTAETELPGKPVFVRIQTRYDAYSKYASKVNIGLDAVKSMKDADSIAANAPTALLGLRPMGLLANNLLAYDSITNELLLARFYVNQAYFALSDIADGSAADPSAAVRDAKRNLNAYLIMVNRSIPPEKVGPKFPLFEDVL